jgi:hypothetical protein
VKKCVEKAVRLMTDERWWINSRAYCEMRHTQNKTVPAFLIDPLRWFDLKAKYAGINREKNKRETDFVARRVRNKTSVLRWEQTRSDCFLADDRPYAFPIRFSTPSSTNLYPPAWNATLFNLYLHPVKRQNHVTRARACDDVFTVHYPTKSHIPLPLDSVNEH